MARFARRLGPVLLILSFLLAGCAPAPAAHDRSFPAMDTFMSLTAYGDGAQDALTRVQEEILRLESLLNVTDEQSEVYALNHRSGDTVSLSQDTADLLALSLVLARETGGAFDPTIYPVVRKWGFTTGRYRVPAPEELESLLSLVEHGQVLLGNTAVTLNPGMMLDFGGIAKGWAGDRAVQVLKDAGISSAILRLGGNIQTMGTKPNGSAWNIGIEDPATGGMLAALAVSDLAVVTSGSYQRYFTAEGQTYHHIIDPATGRPADNGLTSVTIIGPSGARCDALSTALFVMGLEQGAQFWRERRDFEAIFVNEDGSIAITAGLEGSFTLSEPGTRTVEVLR